MGPRLSCAPFARIGTCARRATRRASRMRGPAMYINRSFKRGVRTALGAVGTAFLAAVSASGCSQETAPQATAGEPAAVPAAPADLPAGYARLGHGAIPASRVQLDRGPLDPARRISNLSMAFKLSPAQLADREALKAAL